MPEQSSAVVSQIRYFMGDTMGSYYLIIGLVIFFVSLYLAFSKYGNIVLGRQDEKPKYSFFAWGSMMFTTGLAADILFYSFSEWAYYAESARVAELGGEVAAAIQEWAPVFPLFHWSIIPWGFYLVLASAFNSLFGVGSTLVSFMILGNYSLGRQMSGKSDFLKTFNGGEGIYDMIIEIIETLPAAPVILALVIIIMLLLYASSFDAIALVASRYSYKKLKKGEEPSKWIQLMWCILLIVLPIALLFAGSSRSNIESVSIVSAFPLALVLVLITISFLKDAKKFSREQAREIQSESAEETVKTEE